jgi:hypothetical protein
MNQRLRGKDCCTKIDESKIDKSKIAWQRLRGKDCCTKIDESKIVTQRLMSQRLLHKDCFAKDYSFYRVNLS